MEPMSWMVFGKTLVLGLCIGVAIGMTGVGGGAIIQPVLIHLLGVPAVPAIGTGLVYAMITKIGGAVSHIRQRTVRPRRSFFFLLGSVPAVVLASRGITHLYQAGVFDPARVDRWMRLTMAALLLATAAVIVWQDMFLRQEMARRQSAFYRGGPFPARKKWISVGAGFGIGLVVGATSIGGGVLIIPVFMLLLDATAAETVGSSIVISVFLSGVGGAMYWLGGHVVVSVAAGLCLGSIPGVALGSRLAGRLPERALRWIVVALMALSGCSLLIAPAAH